MKFNCVISVLTRVNSKVGMVIIERKWEISFMTIINNIKLQLTVLQQRVIGFSKTISPQ